MFKYWLPVSLIALIALQSVVVAMADSDQVHQLDAQHLEVTLVQEDDSAYENSGLEKFDRSSPSDPLDCDHCCHCHGVACAALVSNYVHDNLPTPMLTAAAYEFFYPSGPTASPFRPPIA